jgi:hypothetical protein
MLKLLNGARLHSPSRDQDRHNRDRLTIRFGQFKGHRFIFRRSWCSTQ